MLYTQNVVIIKNGNVEEVKEINFKSNEDFLIVELMYKEQTVHKAPFGSSIIKINEDKIPATLKISDKSGNILKIETISLSKEEIEELTEEEKRNQQIEEFIKNKMDFPTGTAEDIEFHSAMLQRATFDKNAKNYILTKIKQHLASSKEFDLDSSEIKEIAPKVYSKLYGMGVLEELDSDTEVGEIMVVGTVFPEFDSEIYYIKNNKKILYPKKFKSLEELKQIFSRTIAFENKELNSVENAVIEATRENKDRINIIIPNASENYILNIRKFANFVPNLNSMKEYGTVTDEINDLLKILVQGKTNIGIGGEMGTGKTTLINFLLSYTEKSERKVVIASVVETDINRVLKGHDVPLLTVDEDKGFTFNKLMKAALRTTASRIIVPESRGEEFKQIYEANLKTKGNMFTAHALDDESFLDMCVDMYMSAGTGNENSTYIKNKLSKSIDIVIIMGKYGSKIRIKSISEVLLDENRDYKGMNQLYGWEIDPYNPTEGKYVKKNPISKKLAKSLNSYGVSLEDVKRWEQ